MKVYTKEFVVETGRRREIVNITQYVENIVYESKIKEGLVLIFVPHATAALFANEDEKYIKEDYLEFFEKLASESNNYHHNIIDNNADAHLLSSIFKQFYVFPVKDGRIIRGTWQELFLAEFDGPRHRKVIVVVMGNDK